jgi:hypothetical protein
MITDTCNIALRLLIVLPSCLSCNVCLVLHSKKQREPWVRVKVRDRFKVRDRIRVSVRVSARVRVRVRVRVRFNLAHAVGVLFEKHMPNTGKFF